MKENVLIQIAFGIVQAIVDHFNKTGEMLTDEEIITRLKLKADDVEAISNAWLSAHPKQ